MLFLFVKDYHRVYSQPQNEFKGDYISDEIQKWLEETWTKYQVNLWTFVYQWGQYFYETEELWPSTHRRKSNYNFRKYDYDIKQKSNLFNLDSLYRKMPKKPYTKGRKQEFEILLMHFWLHSLEGDDEGYWQVYLEKTLPALEKK